MEIIIIDIHKNQKVIGTNFPIPRIGEKIYLGYNPAPLVTDVLYDFKNEKVIICVDGIVIQ